MPFKIILSKRRGMNFQSFPFQTKPTLIFLRRDIYAHFSPLNLESRNPITTTNGTFHDFLHRHSAVSNHRRETNVSCTINCFLRPGRGARSQIYRGTKLEIGNFLSLSLRFEGGEEKNGFLGAEKGGYLHVRGGYRSDMTRRCARGVGKWSR